jgi:PAS domain S-box-containing protein
MSRGRGSHADRPARSSRRRKRVPRELARAEVEALVSKFASDFISIHARSGEYLYVSENVEEMFGWKPGQLVGRRVHDYVHPEDAGAVRAKLARHAGLSRARIEFRLRCADGTWRRVETRCRAEASGASVRRLVCLTRDVQRDEVRATALAELRPEASRDSSFLPRIKEAIARLGFARSATAEAVAGELAIGLRTLQRRLKERSWTVSRLRSSVFQEIAERMLKQGSAADEIARRLGFSSRSSFQRAFRRWTGTTPGHFRKRAQASG